MLQVGIFGIQPITLVLLEIFTSNFLGRLRSVPSYWCTSLGFIIVVFVRYLDYLYLAVGKNLNLIYY